MFVHCCPFRLVRPWHPVPGCVVACAGSVKFVYLLDQGCVEYNVVFRIRSPLRSIRPFLLISSARVAMRIFPIACSEPDRNKLISSIHPGTVLPTVLG